MNRIGSRGRGSITGGNTVLNTYGVLIKLTRMLSTTNKFIVSGESAVACVDKKEETSPTSTTKFTDLLYSDERKKIMGVHKQHEQRKNAILFVFPFLFL